MTDLLLQTKLQPPPTRSELVARPALHARLDACLSEDGKFPFKLTLLSAPAGYGKTTLAAAWLQTAGDPLAWISLDEEDNDPARFLAYLLAGMQRIAPQLGEGISQMLAAPQPPPIQIVLTVLLNQIAGYASPCILALDDYHVITTPAIHQQVDFLLDHLPSNLHMVILTRVDPPLPLHRLRARGQINEFRQDDLRFSAQETTDFLQSQMGIDLDAGQVSALQRRTEGWVAGLQLAALAMQSQVNTSPSSGLETFLNAFTDSNRYILDYLFEEVFQAQPEAIQSFLLHTAVLNRFTADLCDAVAGISNSRQILEALENANLFIVSLDQTRRWYRYHRLFSDLLRHRLQIQEPEARQSLHQRAAAWFEAQGALSEAVHHALAAQDWETIRRLIGQVDDELLRNGEIATLLRWFAQIPPAIIHDHPRLCLAYAWPLILASQYDAAEPLLERAESLAPAEEKTMQGQIAAAQAYLARSRGQARQAVEYSERALALLPPEDLLARGNLTLNLGIAYWHGGQMELAHIRLNEALQAAVQTNNYYGQLAAEIFLARVDAVQGKLRQAAQRCRAILQTGSGGPLLALVHQDLVNLHYEWDQLETAREHLDQSIEICQRTQNREFLIASHILQARISLGLGQPGAAVDALQRSHKLVPDDDLAPPTRARRAACHVLVALSQNDLTAAQAWSEQAGANTYAHSLYRFLGLNPARLLLASGQKDAAAKLLADCAAQAAQGGWGYGLLAVHILQALAAPTTSEAVPFLRQALQIGQPEGFIRSFVEEGQALVPLLQEAAAQGVHPEYVGRILNAFDPTAAAASTKGRAGASDSLVEPLSERELEVLRLVAAGLSNREIAAKLILSLGTVKSHIHNIYGKLGARNRAQAIAHARQHNLL